VAVLRRFALLLVVAASGCGKKAASQATDAAVAVAASAPAPAPMVAMAVDAGVPTDAAPGDIFVVTPVSLTPGTSATTSFEAVLDFDLNFGGMQTITSTKQSKRKTIAIEKVDSDGTVHERITYTKRDTHIVIDGDPHRDDTPVRGKTFLVTSRDGVLDVRRKNGAKATDAEVEAVRKEEGQLQSPEIIGRLLGGIELVKGQPLDVPAAILGPMSADEYKAQRVVLTYRGKEADDLARIDVEAQLANPEDAGVHMFIDITGTLLLDPTGWCREVDAEIKVRAELNGVVVGSGKGSGKVTTSALR
jgi:hypothetical protein